MKVLLTGANGFIGSSLHRALSRSGYSTLATSRSGDGPILDALKPEEWRTHLLEFAPTVVVHCAGRLVGSMDELMVANRDSVACAVEALSKWSPEAKLVILGSAAEVGDPGGKPVSEDVVCKPISPYGQSKWAGSQVALGSGLKVTIVRPTNVVGFNMPRTNLIGSLLDLPNGQHRKQVNRLDMVRDFVDIRDLVRGIIEVCKIPNPPKIVGIGTGVGSGLSDIALAFARFGIEIEFFEVPLEERKPESPYFVADISLARAVLGYEPKYDLAAMISDARSGQQ